MDSAKGLCSSTDYCAYLEWIPLPILGHDEDNPTAVAELAHFARTPSVHIPFVCLMPAILPQEVIEIVTAVVRCDMRTIARNELIQLQIVL